MSDLASYIIYPLNETAAVIDLGNNIDENFNQKVINMQRWLRQYPFTGLKDLVAAYSSLTVLYDPFVVYQTYRPSSTAFQFVETQLKKAWQESLDWGSVPGRKMTIPVCYDPVFGPDLKYTAAAKQMTTGELIRLHCSVSYRVFMIGFLPGFAYMGKVDGRLVMPRKLQPREQVEAGSVGIAGWQTGIYPLQSPGGWQIIGRTPVRLFNAPGDQPALLAAGDTVHFYPISPEAFERFTSEIQYSHGTADH